MLLVLLLITNLGFFSALLNYLLFVGFVTLHQNNVVLVSLIISGQVIFSIVAVVTLVCIVNKYFLNKQSVVYDIADQNMEITQMNEDKGANGANGVNGGAVKDIGGDPLEGK